MKRHNKAMERKAFLEKSGRGLHLKPYKSEDPFSTFRPWPFDLKYFVKKLKIPDFNIECGILNLDLNDGNGTHWTSWYKSNSEIHSLF